VNNIDDRIYVGSTKQPLYKRWNEHKKRWRQKDLGQYRSSILFDLCGYENCKIILVEEFEAENIEQVHKKERESIDKYKPICVNAYLPFKTVEEHNIDKETYAATRKKVASTDEFKRKTNEWKAVRYCCILCKSEMRRDSFSRHYKTVH
jgi:hypothetical protein